MRVGYFEPSAVLAPGGEPLGGDVDYRIFKSETNANNSYADGINFILGGSRPEPMKPGKYFVRATLGYRGGLTSITRIFPFEIKANDVSAPVFDMQAGALSHKVTSKSGNRIINIDYIRESDGARVHYHNLGTSHTLALPSDRYFLRVKINGGKTYDTDPFDIAAGKTTTVNVTIP